jgi:hypothetical protein
MTSVTAEKSAWKSGARVAVTYTVRALTTNFSWFRQYLVHSCVVCVTCFLFMLSRARHDPVSLYRRPPCTFSFPSRYSEFVLFDIYVLISPWQKILDVRVFMCTWGVPLETGK